MNKLIFATLLIIVFIISRESSVKTFNPDNNPNVNVIDPYNSNNDTKEKDSFEVYIFDYNNNYHDSEFYGQSLCGGSKHYYKISADGYIYNQDRDLIKSVVKKSTGKYIIKLNKSNCISTITTANNDLYGIIK